MAQIPCQNGKRVIVSRLANNNFLSKTYTSTSIKCPSFFSSTTNPQLQTKGSSIANTILQKDEEKQQTEKTDSPLVSGMRSIRIRSIRSGKYIGKVVKAMAGAGSSSATTAAPKKYSFPPWVQSGPSGNNQTGTNPTYFGSSSTTGSSPQVSSSSRVSSQNTIAVRNEYKCVRNEPPRKQACAVSAVEIEEL